MADERETTTGLRLPRGEFAEFEEKRRAKFVRPGQTYQWDGTKGVAENQALATYALANAIMQVGYSLINTLREITNEVLAEQTDEQPPSGTTDNTSSTE